MILPAAAGDDRAYYDDLFGVYAPIAIAALVVAGGTLIVLAVVYRRRGRSRRGTSEAPLVEGLWATVLVGIAVLLIVLTFRTDEKVVAISKDPGLRIDVRAFRWGWSFDYTGAGVRQIGDAARQPTLVVPTGTTVQFRLTTLDVIHSFYVPERRFKRDAIPGRVNVFDISWDAPGLTKGRCAEFCGLDHTFMLFDVRAVTPPEFARWLAAARAQQAAHPPPEPPIGSERP